MRILCKITLKKKYKCLSPWELFHLSKHRTFQESFYNLTLECYIIIKEYSMLTDCEIVLFKIYIDSLNDDIRIMIIILERNIFFIKIYRL